MLLGKDQVSILNKISFPFSYMASKEPIYVMRWFLWWLLTLQSQHDELEAKFFEERAALEAKYQKLYEPLYTKVLNY